RRFAPASPTATLVFYHGGGAHSGAGYQHVGSGLQSQYNIAVYTPDIRGHGASGGPRGDAPNPEQVWADVTTLIHRARTDHPGVPVFLGGHSSGAALALSYAGQADHEPVSGYVLVSPQLGSQAHVDRSSAATPFVRVDGAAFAGYAASRGTLHGHDYAVQFNYPAELLARDPGLVPAITVNMSVALIPAAPESAFAGLDRPFGLWIGSEDELFIPEKVLAFGELATSVRPASEIGTIRGANHLGVLLKAHEAAGPWMVKTVQNP
ncbi:MAG TPA: alpha/beta fold hydrolase, partial [Anaerolineales bacterium]|nr:alpha/beta fold hydrolase [Anaerolineales bacterium]